MEVLTIEATAFKRLEGMFEQTLKTVTELAEENKRLKDDRWLDTKEAAEYTGLSEQWFLDRKADIGCSQFGSKVIRFKKSKIEEYFKRSDVSIPSKSKSKQQSNS